MIFKLIIGMVSLSDFIGGLLVAILMMSANMFTEMLVSHARKIAII